MKFELTEHQIQSQVISYLQLSGYYVMRMNSGKYSVGEGATKRFIKGHEAGTPDVMAFKPETDLLFVEVKRPKKKPTQLQESKMKELEEYGAKCIVVHSLDELIKNL